MYTALRNSNPIAYQEMSSWAALAWYIGMKASLDQTYQKQICLDFYCDDF